MKQCRLRIVALAIVLGAGSQVQAGVVVPNANAATAGNADNRFPFLVSGGIRYQQVFGASQFPGTMLISEMDLRNGIFVSQAFTSTISNIQISLSTIATAPDSLSATFANNTGVGTTLVYNGA